MYKAIIWDLDGTLIDTSLGIFNSVRYTEQKMNLIPLSDEKLVEYIGPKLLDSYVKQFSLNKITAEKAVVFHREYGNKKGIYESKVYPGIAEILKVLHKKGVKMAVATMKPEEMALKILTHFDLAQYFDEIIGMDSENTRNKKINIEIALNRMEVISNETLMIGDSEHDAKGASDTDVDFVAVTYGFGMKSEREILDSKAKFIIEGADDLNQLLTLTC
ncbi:phosphoglycolate phosphatase [Lactococcus hodotermopsidis]|uniref:Phosphoglycolate phosphatase n=1 Tax=Pseudolactococcus hodotermopsidis TaxID=2709157 RepID=A0A6A0BBX1_9LACT|nr:HAD-IA family hydrolase [Lactococcus hodotermopsidis]GFH41884.1 phosphoglycolate phosphatase [Lactococcus hodotermopsidis]